MPEENHSPFVYPSCGNVFVLEVLLDGPQHGS